MPPAARPLADLVAAFRDRTLPKEEWTHAAHLRVGLWHVLALPLPEALAALRTGIRTYNEAVGGVNTDDAGYHETITRFYVWLIARAVAAADDTRDAEALADTLVARYGARDLPLRWWSRERLFSREARLGWVPPDLRPLDDVPAPLVG